MKKIYQDNIDSIVNIRWFSKNPYDIAYLSLVTATEFAESLSGALKFFPDDKLLKSVAEEELWTTNLQFQHYNKKGHHAHFLQDFFVTRGLFQNVSEQAYQAGKEYLRVMRETSAKHRAMTIFSREVELPHIFREIIEAHDWKKNNLDFYEYYLRKHIELDSGDDGHGSRVKDLPQDETVLLSFYSNRYLLYRKGLQDEILM